MELLQLIEALSNAADFSPVGELGISSNSSTEWGSSIFGSLFLGSLSSSFLDLSSRFSSSTALS